MKKLKSKLIRWLYPLARIYWRVFKSKCRGVKAVIRHGDEFLLVRHSYGYRRLWVLPGGGVKNDESPEEAATREIKEEVGIEVGSIKNHGSILHVGEHKTITLWVFSAEVPDKDFKIDEVEIKDARWFHRERLPFVLSEVSFKCFEMLKW